MKKLWQLIKKLSVLIAGTCAGAAAYFLLDKVNGKKADETMDVLEKYMEKETLIEGKAETKRDEAYKRVAGSSARDVTNSSSGACDAIADGIERYRMRCGLLRKNH